MCHYAMHVWPRSHYNSWHIFGHSHGALSLPGKRWDVGVDNNNYMPVSMSQLRIIMDKKSDNINYRTRLSLLRVLTKAPEFFPSRVLFDVVQKGLDSDDWALRAHSVNVLKHWLSYDSEQWINLQDDIRARLDKLREVEEDFHVLFLLDDE